MKMGNYTRQKHNEQDVQCVVLEFILKKRPHRFDQLKERSPKEWEYWMYKCCTDEETGEKYGWARVLDYIGVEYEEEN